MRTVVLAHGTLCMLAQTQMAEWDRFISRVTSRGGEDGEVECGGGHGGGSAGAGDSTSAPSTSSTLRITYDMMPWIGPAPSDHHSRVPLMLCDLGVRELRFAKRPRPSLVLYPQPCCSPLPALPQPITCGRFVSWGEHHGVFRMQISSSDPVEEQKRVVRQASIRWHPVRSFSPSTWH
jgi:hypothetical protein